MKFAVLFVCCVLGVLRVEAGEGVPPEMVDLLKNLSNTCKEEAGVEQSVLDAYIKADLVDDPKGKCYLKCMMRQLQTMQEDGHLDIELIEATMPDFLKSRGAMDTIHKCKHIHEADLCDTAFNLMKCFKEENPALYSFFE